MSNLCTFVCKISIGYLDKIHACSVAGSFYIGALDG